MVGDGGRVRLLFCRIVGQARWYFHGIGIADGSSGTYFLLSLIESMHEMLLSMFIRNL